MGGRVGRPSNIMSRGKEVVAVAYMAVAYAVVAY